MYWNVVILVAPNVVSIHVSTNHWNCRYDSDFEVIVGAFVPIWIDRVLNVAVNAFE